MENVLETIRAAIAKDATPEARAAGTIACRAVLAALESTPGQPLAAAAAVPPPSTTSSPIATAVAVLRGVPAEQLLDLAIVRLRAALPPGVDVPAAMPLKFNLIAPPKGFNP